MNKTRYQLYFFKNEGEMRKWPFSKGEIAIRETVGPIITRHTPAGIGHELIISDPFRERYVVPDWTKYFGRFIVRKVIHVIGEEPEKSPADLYLVPAK